ncbi:MAG: hypothetical protein QXX20_07385 [Candidatus Thermoplasmatota archaeon]
MQKIIVTLYALIVGIVLCSAPVFGADTGLIVEKNAVSISLDLGVQEDISVRNIGFDNITSLRFWVQQPLQGSIEVYALNTAMLIPTVVSGNIHTCNLSLVGLEIPAGGTLRLRLVYTLTSVNYFDKTILYPTSLFSIDFNNENLFEGKELTPGVSCSLSLYVPSAGPLEFIWIFIIVVIVILFIFFSLILLRRQRFKAKTSIVETEEVLKTKKSLLLSLLKDLEKQHRAKEISDDTYHKLKEEYKQQAVLVMKKVDDLEK